MEFVKNWDFMLLHMPAVKKVLCDLPAGTFLDILTAEPKRDMNEATDLVVELAGGTLAVRVRRKKHLGFAKRFGFDFSVRCESRGNKTEIHKLRDGFGDWYFYGYSGDDKGSLAYWWLFDLDKIREDGILNKKWKIHSNGDGTSGMYIPISELGNCIMAVGETQ